MKIINKIISASAVALALLMAGCVSEAPFNENGEGTLRLSAQLRGDVTSVVTRADANYDQSTLENNLVVYIQKENVGVVRKFIGLESINGANVALQTGKYVVEGWTGDSVSASFDKKFYYGYQPIVVNEGNNSMSLKCDIANVLTSINTERLQGKVSDLTMEIGHTRGSLVFDSERIAADPKGENKGYFMMPNGVTDLYYKISGKNENGEEFVKEGELNGVLRAHDYQFILKADASEITQGGAMVKIEIVEVPVIDEQVTVFPAPTFRLMMGGELLNGSKQLNFTKGGYSDLSLRVLAYKGLPSLKISFSDNFPSVGGMSGIDVIADGTALLPSEFITQRIDNEDNVAGESGETVSVVEYWLTIPADYISSLPASDMGYCITLEAKDGKNLSNRFDLRWANTSAAIEQVDPVVSLSQDDYIDFSAVTARSATLYGEILDPESAVDYGIMLREAGAEEWVKIPAIESRAGEKKFSVKATGLKPATTYQYKSYAKDFEENLVKTFTTESVFSIPDASFEEWSSYSAKTLLGTKNVTLPGSTGDKLTSFWGSGNEGAATANLTLTNKSTDMKHSGSYSARLASNSAMGVIAAGNIFVGHYVETDGTNGVLSLGRIYDGSHPSALKVFANYRPGSGVSIKDGTDSSLLDGLTSGGTDQAQIYVALTTEPYEIRTNPSKRKLFDAEDPSVVAYGQVTWKEAFGPDGGLQEVLIPLKYNVRAKTLKPTHLVIVCSASKFGDYFCGSKNSVMHLDDFELVYDPSGISFE